MMRSLAISALLFLLLMSAVDAKVCSGPFEQVPTRHWAYRAVDRLNCEWCPTLSSWGSVISAPRTAVRYEFAVVTARVCVDICKSEEARRRITSLQLAGLLRLVDEFAPELSVVLSDRGNPPDWTVTRPLDAKALMHLLPSPLSASPAELDPKDYPELAQTPPDHWAYGATKRLYELGIFEDRWTR